MWFAFPTPNSEGKYPFALGLDLAGGSTLTYRAETGSLVGREKDSALNSLRDVIERRTNLFGVSEPLVQIEKASVLGGVTEDRLVVELPGITNIDEALKIIGETPLLEFKLKGVPVFVPNAQGELIVDEKETYTATGLTGSFVEKAELSFGQGGSVSMGGQAVVLLHFNAEGAKLFETITRDNVGKQLAIFLDGVAISEPTIQEVIPGGTASITGQFTPDEAKTLVRDLNFGALPIPIELVGTGTVGATLGSEALSQGILAGSIGVLLIVIFMTLWYRMPGLVSGVALLFYVATMLAFIKVIPVVLTASGIAGLILSIGMAVDANVLIFERMREEQKRNHALKDSMKLGFDRAWPAIRDAHVSSILAAIVLFWLGTSIVQGFALVFGLGVLLSLFSAIVVTRSLLLAIAPKGTGKMSSFLFGRILK